MKKGNLGFVKPAFGIADKGMTHAMGAPGPKITKDASAKMPQTFNSSKPARATQTGPAVSHPATHAAFLKLGA